VGWKARCGRDVPRINIGADVWGESSIMTGVFQRCFSSTSHIGWGLCDRVCLVLVCGGRYCFGGVVLLFILGSSLGEVGPVRDLHQEKTADFSIPKKVCNRPIKV
jgi:hypothetical protein